MFHTSTTAKCVPSSQLNNGLILQFILAEFMAVFEQIRKLEALGDHPPFNPPKPLLSMESDECLKQIRAALTKLGGSSREYLRLFSWSDTEGLLHKLKVYCTLFLQNASADEKELIAMQHYTEKA